jgi:hypothetical protein
MNKKYQIYIVLMIIFIFISLLLVYEINIVEKKDNGYLLLPGNLVLYKEKDNLEIYQKAISKNDVSVVTSSGIEKLTFTYQNNKITFYKDETEVDLDDELIYGYSSELELENISFNTQELNDNEIEKIDSILKVNGIIGYESLNEAEKLTFDFDQDGVDEEIYFISNLFDETIYDKVFSLVFTIQDNSVNYLLKQIEDVDNTYDLCIPTPSSILKIGNYKLIIRCDYFSELGSKTYLFEKDDTFKLINE